MHQFVKDFFAKGNSDIQTNCCVCSDGAPRLLGNTSRFYMLMKGEISQLQVSCCFLRHHTVAEKTLPSSLKEVLNTCLKTLAWITHCVLNHCVFKLLATTSKMN